MELESGEGFLATPSLSEFQLLGQAIGEPDRVPIIRDAFSVGERTAALVAGDCHDRAGVADAGRSADRWAPILRAIVPEQPDDTDIIQLAELQTLEPFPAAWHTVLTERLARSPGGDRFSGGLEHP